MVYDLEFLRRIEGKAEMMAQDFGRLIGEQLTEVIIKPNELFRQIAVAPIPDGYRLRGSDGSVVYDSLVHLARKALRGEAIEWTGQDRGPSASNGRDCRAAVEEGA